MRNQKPLLRIKISGPAIKPGHIPIPLLVEICTETQKAVNRQAEALQGRRSLRPGPATRIVAKECTLELVGIKKGSTTLNFLPVSEQQTLPEVETMRAEAIDGVAIALSSVAKKRGRPETRDLGVFDALDRLGNVLDEGISELKIIVPHHNGRKRNLVASLTPSIRPKIRAQLQPPLVEVAPEKINDGSLVEGTIEITEGKGRIMPSVGSPTSFSFDRKQAEEVYEARHKPVKANLDPRTHKLRKIEVTVLPGRPDFFAEKTIDQLIAEQDVQPIISLETLSGAIPDEDVDEFIAEIYRERMS